MPQCTRQQLDASLASECPADSQIGIDKVGLGSVGEGLFEIEIPVYNMVPPAGVPGQFAFDFLHVQVFIDGGLRSGGDNGITAHIDNLVQRAIIYNSVTLFGEPEGKPLLTLPASCGGPLRFSAQANTWEDEGATAEASTETPAVTGCGRLTHFSPSISATPDTSMAAAPAGLVVEVGLPQGLNPEGLATSGLEDSTVMLPAGLAVNPGRAAGLEACQPSQEGLGSEADEGPSSCPAASRIGTIEVETPVLKDKLVGGVYVVQSNPPNLQLLLAPSGDGVNLKLLGMSHLDEATGQLTATCQGYTGSALQPNVELTFEGGPQATLVTPGACGVYATQADFTPWSSPFVPDAFPTSSFAIESGVGGRPCGSPLSFSPSFTAGSSIVRPVVSARSV